MTEYTPMSKVSRLEVIQAGARRRWSLAEKQRIVAEGESVPRQVSATAPYLHNGSVPTLNDMLLPQDKRPAVFCVGSREFDPVAVGPKG